MMYAYKEVCHKNTIVDSSLRFLLLPVILLATRRVLELRLAFIGRKCSVSARLIS